MREEQTGSPSPLLHTPRPALKVGDFKEAMAHYVDWLGFQLDWEWREARGEPAIAALSRDHFTFMVNEHPDAVGPAAIHLEVENLPALVEEWNQRRPGAAVIRTAPPYEFPEAVVEDPWGNRLYFEGKLEAEEVARRETVAHEMRAFIAAELEAGRPLPTPEALRSAVGPPLGVAIEVLNGYPEYGALHAARNSDESRNS